MDQDNNPFGDDNKSNSLPSDENIQIENQEEAPKEEKTQGSTSVEDLIKEKTSEENKENLQNTAGDKKRFSVATVVIICIAALALLAIGTFFAIKTLKIDIAPDGVCSPETISEMDLIDSSRLKYSAYSLSNIGDNFSFNTTNQDGQEKTISFKEDKKVKFVSYNTDNSIEINVGSDYFDVNVGISKNELAKIGEYPELKKITNRVDSGELLYKDQELGNYYYYATLGDVVFEISYAPGDESNLSEQQILEYARLILGCFSEDDSSAFILDKAMLVPLVLDKHIASEKHIEEVSTYGINLLINDFSISIMESNEDSLGYGETISSDPLIKYVPGYNTIIVKDGNKIMEFFVNKANYSYGDAEIYTEDGAEEYIESDIEFWQPENASEAIDIINSVIVE